MISSVCTLRRSAAVACACLLVGMASAAGSVSAAPSRAHTLNDRILRDLKGDRRLSHCYTQRELKRYLRTHVTPDIRKYTPWFPRAIRREIRYLRYHRVDINRTGCRR